MRKYVVVRVACAVFLTSACSEANRALAFQTPQYLENLSVDDPAIQYREAVPHDPVSRLVERVERGEVKLQASADRTGFLGSVLDKLGIQTDSQALAFAKGSFQAAKVSPRNPRAVYFTVDAAAGYVPGGDEIELAGVDPRQGIVFYTLESGKDNRPLFRRQTICLECHQGPATLGVPGIFVGSVYPGISGIPASTGGIITDHRTRFEDRWGGWYVTGTHGAQRHRGNALAPDPAEPEILETAGTQNLTDLRLKFNPAPYLTPLSDIVALMTLEHQTQMTNLLIRVGWEARIAAKGSRKDPAAHPESRIREIVEYMLFADEAPLESPVAGVSSFTQTFPARGPRDGKGRSLRDFDLQRRLFRYPLSYMIYSAIFDALPEEVRNAIYQGIYDVLIGRNTNQKFSRLSMPDRRTILEILHDTKTNLPPWWKIPT